MCFNRFALFALVAVSLVGCQKPLNRHRLHAKNSAQATTILKTIVDEKTAMTAAPALSKLADEWDKFLAGGTSKTGGAPTEMDMKAVSKSRADFMAECERVKAIPGVQAKIGETLARLCHIR
jgi:hypothetical protein